MYYVLLVKSNYKIGHNEYDSTFEPYGMDETFSWTISLLPTRFIL